MATVAKKKVAVKKVVATKKVVAAKKAPVKKSSVATKSPPLKNGKKVINLALQGGGAHGAFAWGVIDKILEDGRIEIEGISGTSAGSMNAAVLAYGMIKGPENARRVMEQFWKKISDVGKIYNPLKLNAIEKMMGVELENSMANHMSKMISHNFSPYQTNPKNFNPLKDALVEIVDFDDLNANSPIKLFLTATNVRTGKARVFHPHEITPDVVLASACLPFMFQAVEIENDFYWDGGYMGNPVLYPLIAETDSNDILIVHINPIERAGPPKTSEDIQNRVNEITFNTSLIKELRAIHFVQEMINKKWIKDEFKDELKYVLIHSLRADNAMTDLSVTTKLSSDWEFLTMLRDRGRTYAEDWLKHNFEHLNVRNSVDMKKEFL